MSDGTHGHGTTLAGAIGTNTTTIGSIINISLNATRDSIDVSHLTSTGKFREFIPGVSDPGEATLTINYDGSDSGTSDKLNTLYQSGSTAVWTVTFAGNTNNTWVSNGIITYLGDTIPFDDKITQDVTIKFSGEPNAS